MSEYPWNEKSNTFTRLSSLFYNPFNILQSSYRRCSVKNVFLEIAQNSQENTRARDFFKIKLQPLGQQLYLQRVSGTGVFLWILRNF